MPAAAPGLHGDAPVLHYFHDPLCGWCYAAEPLVQALAEGTDIEIVLHGGGLFSGGPLPADKRQMIRGADARIGQLTGQRFEAPYLDGLLQDPATVYDSAPPIAAVLAAQSLGDTGLRHPGLAMLRAVQHAHYRAGRPVVRHDVLVQAAQALGFDGSAFAAALAAQEGEPVSAHIAATRERMRRLGAGGFPSFLLQRGTAWWPVRHEAFYGKPADFVAELRQLAAAG